MGYETLTVFIVIGSGESAKEIDFNLVRQSGLPVIVTNNAYQIYPEANILVGADSAFFKTYRPQFSGLKFCRQSYRDSIFFTTDEMEAGICSGVYACHVAKALNARKIILLGIDLKGGHFHPDHPDGLKNPSEKDFSRYRKQFANLKGYDIINATEGSALDCFPKMTLEAALAEAHRGNLC